MFRGVVARIALDLGRGLGPRGRAYPCERTPVSPGDLLDVDQLLDELGERWFVEVKLALEGAERDATLLFEVLLRTTNTLQEGHRSWIGLLRQLIQERLRVLEILRVEPLGEPAVDRGEQGARFDRLALAVP